MEQRLSLVVVFLIASVVAVTAVEESTDAVVRLADGQPEDGRQAALNRVKSLTSPDDPAGGGVTEASASSKRIELLENEVSELKAEQRTVAEKTAIDLRAKLNQEKEVYYKKMKAAGSRKAVFGKVAARAAAKVAKATEEAGKYRAINKVLLKKAAYTDSLKSVIAGMTGKMHTALEATQMLTEKEEEDSKTIAKLNAEVASLKGGAAAAPSADGGSDKEMSIEKQIKHEKKMARQAHRKSATLHKQAAKEHKKAGSDADADEAEKESTKSEDESKDAKIADKAETDKDEAKKDAKEAKKDEKEAKKLEKKAKEAKKEAKKEKKKAKKIEKAKKKAKKLQKEADKAKKDAGVDKDLSTDDDDDEDEVGDSDTENASDSDSDTATDDDNDDDDDTDDEVSGDDIAEGLTHLMNMLF